MSTYLLMDVKIFYVNIDVRKIHSYILDRCKDSLCLSDVRITYKDVRITDAYHCAGLHICKTAMNVKIENRYTF